MRVIMASRLPSWQAASQVSGQHGGTAVRWGKKSVARLMAGVAGQKRPAGLGLCFFHYRVRLLLYGAGTRARIWLKFGSPVRSAWQCITLDFNESV